jgi:hypothetical protein
MKRGDFLSFLTAQGFVFNNQNSDDYNLTIAWTGSPDIDISENGLNFSLEKTKNKSNNTTNTYGIQSENIVINFNATKKDFTEITRLESIRINEWLTSSSTPKNLAFNDNDSYPLHYYAVCTQIEDVIVGGRLVGKNLRFETNSPFAFSKKVEKKIDVINSHVIHINNTSNANNNIIYPKMIISSTSSTIVIENVTDKKSVTINTINISAESDGAKYIKLDSYNMSATDKNNRLIPLKKLGWDNAYKSYVSAINDYIANIYWVRFIKGINEIKITGNCIITIEYECPRKAGCL